MTYWRMQLHPSEPGDSIGHCVRSLAAGYIGLDFGKDVGDLTKLTKGDLPDGQRDYVGFANEMKPKDVVLIVAHHFPFALVSVVGHYNYIRHTAPEIGVWFRHFRQVSDIRYYADYKTDVRKWDHLKMTNTIAALRDEKSRSYLLIKEWLKSA